MIADDAGKKDQQFVFVVVSHMRLNQQKATSHLGCASWTIEMAMM